MAEERLIDDDKDKKYKIRKNADGEDELYIDTSSDGEEETLEFEIPEFEEDDEEAAVMTPEQLAARQVQREEEEKKRLASFAACVEGAKELLQKSDFDKALYKLSEAEKLGELNGEALTVKLKAMSKNLTDFSLYEDLGDVADELKEKASTEQKSELSEMCGPLLQRASDLKKEIDVLDGENEKKKTERRGVFMARRKKSLIFTACAVVPFITFLILAIYFFTVRYALENGTNVVLTIVFACLAAVCFIITLIALHKLWECARNVRLNEKNSSTKLGRELEEKKSELKELTRIYAAINEV